MMFHDDFEMHFEVIAFIQTNVSEKHFQLYNWVVKFELEKNT